MLISQRRDEIIKRIQERCLIIDLGHVVEGKPSPCHIWTGGDSGKGTGAGRGYGRISINGKTCATHIVVYTHYYGYIPSKKQIDHLCNTRLCCNPAHLEMVTSKENHKRRVARSQSITASKALSEVIQQFRESHPNQQNNEDIFNESN